MTAITGPVRTFGLPTDEEVRLLIEKFGVPEEGAKIMYEDIALVLGVSRERSRWHTVTAHWIRKMLREHNVSIRGCGGQYFEVLDPEGRADRSDRHVTSAFKKVRRAVKLAVSTDRTRLSEPGQRKVDHVILRGAQIDSARRLEARRVKRPELPPGV